LTEVAAGSQHDEGDVLKGTTLRVYRFLFKEGRAVRLYDIQRSLGLSSPSVAQYHLSKLLGAGFIRETGEGYVVDRALFGNFVRVRRMVLPFQMVYSVFFAASLVVLLSLLKPPTLTSSYFFALVVIWIGLGFSLFESIRALRGL
jgi:hypothetical protein